MTSSKRPVAVLRPPRSGATTRWSHVVGSGGRMPSEPMLGSVGMRTLWAEADLNRRFDRPLRLVADREWLAEAARIVLASSGARTPSVDGMDKRRMQAGLDQHLANLRTNLLKGTYRPQPVKRIHIPKANGKLRPLGIPTLTDRIVQRAMLMAMEPIWESDFQSPVLWLPAGAECAPCRPHREDTASGWWRHEGPLDHRR